MIIQLSKGVNTHKTDYQEPSLWMDVSGTVAVLLHKLYKYLLGCWCDVVADDALTGNK